MLSYTDYPFDKDFVYQSKDELFTLDNSYLYKFIKEQKKKLLIGCEIIGAILFLFGTLFFVISKNLFLGEAALGFFFSVFFVGFLLIISAPYFVLNCISTRTLTLKIMDDYHVFEEWVRVKYGILLPKSNYSSYLYENKGAATVRDVNGNYFIARSTPDTERFELFVSNDIPINENDTEE